MLIGVPKEIKTHEYRVGCMPSVVRELMQHGHGVTVEHNAGAGIGIADSAYQAAGATIAPDAAAVWATAELIVKVKEPQAIEFPRLRRGQILFTYLHLAAEPKVTEALIESGAVAFAYETVTDKKGGLPLLAPMSEVAGRMATQVGARCLEREAGGRGVLLSGVPGVEPAHVVILGGGVAGTNAARTAMGMQARVTVIDKSIGRLTDLDALYPSLNTVYATADAIERYVLKADLVIGAVLIPGAATPKLVTAAMVKRMKRGAVLVDISIDQGGCFETSRPTTHAAPTYIVDDVVHYCVTNMPGAVPHTSTFALGHATLPFILALANRGYRKAANEDPHLLAGLNVHQGRVTHAAVARALDLPFQHPMDAIST